MTDSVSTELKFNKLKKNYRSKILPEVKENWHELTSEEQLPMSEFKNLFCGLHSLVHFADTASVALTETKKGFFLGQSTSV